MLEPDYISGLTILGGEPMEPKNQYMLLPFVEAVRSRIPQKTIWLYTGFTYEQLMARIGDCGFVTRHLLSQLDILVNGPFIEAQKNIGLQFRGSENQRIIDLRRTEQQCVIVLWNERNETVI